MSTLENLENDIKLEQEKLPIIYKDIISKKKDLKNIKIRISNLNKAKSLILGEKIQKKKKKEKIENAKS